MFPPFEISLSPGHLVATAIHGGTELRPEVDQLLHLDRSTKRREEDPYTDRLLDVGDIGVRVHRSRFEVDLNRPRHLAVYTEPDDAWGLDLWKEHPSDEIIADSLAIYDSFYASMTEIFDELAASGPFVVYDLHSYNHRRQGPGTDPEPPIGNPDVNVGTGSLDHVRFGRVVDTFIDTLSTCSIGGSKPDVRENVRFRGGHFSQWAHDRYPERACVLALEFKKVFMDEWTDALDETWLADIGAALRSTAQPVLHALSYVGVE